MGAVLPPGPWVPRARSWVPTVVGTARQGLSLSAGAPDAIGALMPSVLCYRGALLAACAGNLQFSNDGQALSLR